MILTSINEAYLDDLLTLVHFRSFSAHDRAVEDRVPDRGRRVPLHGDLLQPVRVRLAAAVGQPGQRRTAEAGLNRSPQRERPQQRVQQRNDDGDASDDDGYGRTAAVGRGLFFGL